MLRDQKVPPEVRNRPLLVRVFSAIQPFEIPLEIPPETPSGILFELSLEIHLEIPLDMHAEIPLGIPLELSLEIHLEIPPEIHREIPLEIHFEIHHHYKTHPQTPYQAKAWSYRYCYWSGLLRV